MITVHPEGIMNAYRKCLGNRKSQRFFSLDQKGQPADGATVNVRRSVSGIHPPGSSSSQEVADRPILLSLKLHASMAKNKALHLF